MTGHGVPPMIETMLMEALEEHSIFLDMLTRDLAKLLKVEMPDAPMFRAPKVFQSYAMLKAIAAANIHAEETAKALIAASRSAAGPGGTFGEVERDANGRVVAVIDPVLQVRRSWIRDENDRVTGFRDTYIGGK